MPDIEKLIESTKFALAEILDQELYQPVKEELKQYDITHSMGIKKEMFKNRMEQVLDELKVDLVRSIVENEALAKTKYEVVFLKARDELIPVKPEQVLEGPQFYGRIREIIDLQEGDIPIGYQRLTVTPELVKKAVAEGKGTRCITELVVCEVVVLRPVAEDKRSG